MVFTRVALQISSVDTILPGYTPETKLEDAESADMQGADVLMELTVVWAVVYRRLRSVNRFSNGFKQFAGRLRRRLTL